MSLPNSEELEAIAEFRKRVEDVVSKEEFEDDMFLIRWIRAREMDLDKAEAMLRNALEWRKNNKVDTILERKMDNFFMDNYPRWTDGVDKEGRPIYTAAVGSWDCRKVVKEGRTAEFLEYTTQGFEELLDQMRKSNEVRGITDLRHPARVNQMISIFDFDGFAWTQLFNFRAVQSLLQLGSIYEAYYPEILHTTLFINSPYLISKVMTLLKPILAPKTMAKITVLGTNREEWQAEILRRIEPDQIRPQFGGTLGLIPTP